MCPLRAPIVLLLLAAGALEGCDDASSATSAPSPAEAPLGKADGSDAQVASIELDADFSPPIASPALVAGGQAHVVYDTQRFYDIYDGQAAYGWFASTFHCYGYGCCEVTFPEVSARWRFDGGAVNEADVSDGDTVIDITGDAESLEMWFHAPGFQIRTWYCGCGPECAAQNYAAAVPQWRSHEGWDSAWGENYTFPVSSGAFQVVHGETVKLVSAVHDGTAFTGEIELRDLAYEKAVRVHYTVLDDAGNAGAWHDLDAAYAGESEDDAFERWSFGTSDAVLEGATIRFAVRYEVAGQAHWDDNCGWNYEVEPGGAAASGHGC